MYSIDSGAGVTHAPAAPSELDVTAAVRSMLCCWPGRVGPWSVEPVDYDVGSPTTAGLFMGPAALPEDSDIGTSTGASR